MFELPDIDFSSLYCSDELEAVGIEDTNDLIKPAVVALLKDGIQRHISACNLSKKACDELVKSLGEEGFDIALDAGIQPNINTLPIVFSDASEDAAEDAEHQKALNYASWALEKIEFDQCDYSTNCTQQEAENVYPLNLLNAVFGGNQKYRFCSPELCSVIQDQIDNLLDTLLPVEEKLLRAMYQNGFTGSDIARVLGVQDNLTVIWAINASEKSIKHKALRKLRHPSRSKKLVDFFAYISYLENVDGATFEDIRNSFLHESRLVWTDEQNEQKSVDWDNVTASFRLEHILDIDAFPAKLIFYADSFRWCPWPVGLLMGTASDIADGQDRLAIKKAYFSTNANWENYLLVVGQALDGEDSYALFEFSERVLKRIPVDAMILKNLHRKIEHVTEANQETDTLRTLYNAERQYCNALFERTTDLREKEYYKMFLELIQNQLNYLPPEKVVVTPIEELDLSLASYNCLRRAAIYTIEELISKSEDELMRDVRSLGRKSLEEILRKLQERGLSLKKE